jgi:hypothetical protein
MPRPRRRGRRRARAASPARCAGSRGSRAGRRRGTGRRGPGCRHPGRRSRADGGRRVVVVGGVGSVGSVGGFGRGGGLVGRVGRSVGSSVGSSVSEGTSGSSVGDGPASIGPRPQATSSSASTTPIVSANRERFIVVLQRPPQQPGRWWAPGFTHEFSIPPAVTGPSAPCHGSVTTADRDPDDHDEPAAVAGVRGHLAPRTRACSRTMASPSPLPPPRAASPC